jgi:hypothetical protein
MKSRLARLGLVFASVLSLLGTTTQPAKANYVFSIAFVASADVAGGLDYPCAELTNTTTATTIDHLTSDPPNLLLTLPTTTLPCPPTGQVPPLIVFLPLQDDPIPNTHIDYHHNRRAVTVTDTQCVGVTVATPEKSLFLQPPAVCDFIVTGTVTGWCGLSGGQVSGPIFNGHSFIFVDIHFNGLGGVITFDGHWFKPIDNQHGLLLGVTTATPPLPGSGQSCLDKTARTFTLEGAATAVTNPLL